MQKIRRLFYHAGLLKEHESWDLERLHKALSAARWRKDKMISLGANSIIIEGAEERVQHYSKAIKFAEDLIYNCVVREKEEENQQWDKKIDAEYEKLFGKDKVSDMVM